LKIYQPERSDFLINTEWGLPADRLSKEEATRSGMKLFQRRWVTKAEKKQLREEYSTYHSIRIMGYLLMVLTLSIFINIGEISKGGMISTSVAVIYGFVMLAAGIGLIKFKRLARNIALFVFLSFIFLPFTPFLSDDKGSPLIIILGISGLYYLLRRTARKIFSPPSGENADGTKGRSSVVRKVTSLMLLLLVFFVIYTIYGMKQSEHMVADVCKQAVKGKLLEDFLAALSKEDYKIIKRPEHTLIVPKRGMGRNHCVVYHDGRQITGSKTGFND
jgi:hypothetical protein